MTSLAASACVRHIGATRDQQKWKPALRPVALQAIEIWRMISRRTAYIRRIMRYGDVAERLKALVC